MVVAPAKVASWTRTRRTFCRSQIEMELQQTRRLFFKKTRKGKVVQPVQEKYLHADLECGFMGGIAVSSNKLGDMVSQAPHKQLLVIDTNIAMHQIDVLEYNCPATSMMVILQTVMQELKHLNNSLYLRLLELVKDSSRSFIFYPNEASSSTSTLRHQNETMNDANDRAIVVAACYFQTILTEKSSGKVVFLTNDVKNKERAIAQGLQSMSMRHYVGKYVTQFPELLDLVAADSSAMEVDNADSQPRLLYPMHLSMHDVMEGLKARRLLKGTIRCERENFRDCYAVVHSADGVSRRSVQIKGSQRVNRAVDGDVVAIELVAGPPTAAELAVDASEDAASADASSAAAGAGVMEDTAVPSADDIEGIAVATTTTTVGAPKAFGLFNSQNGSEQLYGRVVGVIKRNWRQYAGSLECTRSAATTTAVAGAASSMDVAGDDAENSASVLSTTQLFVPVNKRVPKVLISTRRGEELAKSRLLVAIDHWPADSAYPQGHYVRVLGEAGNKEVETQVLLHEFDVPNEAFSPEVMACLPPGDWQITEDVVAQRTDLRHLPVVSIDPPGCKDIDDALHCLRLPNGRLEAGVHIADVTYFVHPDTPIDKEAAHRSTSTYLVERRLDMLPGLLTTQLCSLRSKEDHLAFSVIWEMDDDANIYDVRFCKSAIHSVASLTYDEAQVMLDTPAPKDKVNHSVNLLNKLARILRQRRIDMGALTLASPEVRFKLDSETQNPTDVAMYNLKESNALVEEWMLLANITVSKQILKFYPTLGILRRHQPPSREQFAPLVSSALAVGVDLDISSSKTLADSLDRAVRKDDPYFNKLLRILSTRCMMPAQYFCSGEIPKDQWHHYGLAAPVYTHFTSPIRRYADVLVHRLLAATIGVIALPAGNADRSKQQELCTHMNRRHRAAQYAQRASVNINTISYFRQRPAQQEAAYVLAVKEDSFTVLVPRFGIEGVLRWDEIMIALDCDAMDFDPAAHMATLTRQAASTTNHSTTTSSKPSKKAKKGDKNSSIVAERRENAASAEVVLCVKVFDCVHISIKVDEGSGNGGDRKLVIGLVHQDKDLAEAIRNKPRKTALSALVNVNVTK